jgi:hypothetical protein
MARGEQAQEAVVTALTPEDVLEEAKDVKGLGKDKVRLNHFLQRSWATARALAELKVSFEERLASRANSVTVGTPSNMSPEQAARFLSPDQLSRFFDRFMQDKLSMAETQRKNAEASARQADAVVGALRQVVGSVLSDPGLDPGTRARIAQAVDQAAHLANQLPGRQAQQ